MLSPSRKRKTQGSRRLGSFNAVSLTLAAALSLLVLYPFALVIVRAFVGDGGIDLSPLISAYSEQNLLELLFNTAVITGLSGIAALTVGTSLAWLNERTDAKMGVMTDVLPLLPFFLPAVAGAIGWTFLLSPGSGYANVAMRQVMGVAGIHLSEGPLNIYSWYGMIFVYTLYLVPYVYLMVTSGLRNLDPSLEEQARMSGAGVIRMFRTVTVPSIKPSIGGAVLLVIVFGFALVSVPIVIGTRAGIDVLAVRIARLMSFTFPPELPAAIGLALVVVFVGGTAWYFQNRVLGGLRFATIGGKDRAPARIRLGRTRPIARAFLIGYVLLAAVLPVIALLLVALQGYWTPVIDLEAMSFRSFTRLWTTDTSTRRAITNSLQLATIGATTGILLVAVVSVAMRKSGSGRIARAVDGVIKLPAAIPNLVFGIGFVLAFAGPPFNLAGGLLILLMAYVTIYLPEASVAADAAAAQVGGELTEASLISGAGRSRTFRRISFPLMASGLVAGWALLFVRMAGDVNASVILAGTGNTVVGFRILDILESGTYSSLAALSLVVTAISIIVVAGAIYGSRVLDARSRS